MELEPLPLGVSFRGGGSLLGWCQGAGGAPPRHAHAFLFPGDLTLLSALPCSGCGHYFARGVERGEVPACPLTPGTHPDLTGTQAGSPKLCGQPGLTGGARFPCSALRLACRPLLRKAACGGPEGGRLWPGGIWRGRRPGSGEGGWGGRPAKGEDFCCQTRAGPSRRPTEGCLRQEAGGGCQSPFPSKASKSASPLARIKLTPLQCNCSQCGGKHRIGMGSKSLWWGGGGGLLLLSLAYGLPRGMHPLILGPRCCSRGTSGLSPDGFPCTRGAQSAMLDLP